MPTYQGYEFTYTKNEHAYRNVEWRVYDHLRPTSAFDLVAGVPLLGPRFFEPLAFKRKLQKCRDFMAEHGIHDNESYDSADLDI